MNREGGARPIEVELQCTELADALAFFVDIQGFRLDSIFPADDPLVAVLSGYGVHLRLQRHDVNELPVLVEAHEPVAVPPNQPSFVLSRLGDEAAWHTGRAGMLYRDLIPDRQGGRFIASHILIPEGGEIPDYVHFHEVRFQMIYCYKGWVRVVYEDQGPPFVLHAGDCVLQPPQIRHRVLQSSSGLEVVEIGCPAEHPTHADHELALPTNEVRPQRDFHGQRFLRHVAQESGWQPWRVPEFECRDTGIADATEGLAGARVVRPARTRSGTSEAPAGSADAEFLFTFVLQGSLSLHREGHAPEPLEAGACFTMPSGTRYGLTGFSADLEFLEVSLPAAIESL